MKISIRLCAALTAVLLLGGCGAKEDPSGSRHVRHVPSASVSEPAASPAPRPAASAPADPGPDKPPEPPDQSSVLEPPEEDGREIVFYTSDQLLELVEGADWSFFDDAVMVGDSVSLKLKNFVVQQRQTDKGFFGKTQFLTSGSLGSGNALWEVSEKSVHPTFQGTKMPLEESIPLTGAKKIYMMLGVNDVALYGIDGSVENYQTLLDKIAEKVPDAEFYIQSATPICQGAEVGALNNENLTLYNEKLAEMCEERGCRFVDVASVMRGEDGFLPREYCSDPDGMGIHLTDQACRMWLGCLLADAQRGEKE